MIYIWDNGGHIVFLETNIPRDVIEKVLNLLAVDAVGLVKPRLLGVSDRVEWLAYDDGMTPQQGVLSWARWYLSCAFDCGVSENSRCEACSRSRTEARRLIKQCGVRV